MLYICSYDLRNSQHLKCKFGVIATAICIGSNSQKENGSCLTEATILLIYHAVIALVSPSIMYRLLRKIKELFDEFLGQIPKLKSLQCVYVIQLSVLVLL